MTCGAKVNDFHSVGLPNGVDKHDVLRLQVSMNQSQALQFHQCCCYLETQTHKRGNAFQLSLIRLPMWVCADLLQDGSDVPEGERAKLAVLEEVIKVLLQHLKHQTGVTLVLETLV